MTATLGIDTSGMIGSVALLVARDDGPPSTKEIRFEEGMIHGVALAPEVKHLLDEAGLKARDLTLIAVGLGPGSYTGVRVGVAFAKTMAFAADVPIIGVPTFDAVARSGPDDRVIACVRNARRDALYVGVYEPGGTPRGEVALVALSTAREHLPSNALILGDAVKSHPDFLSGDGRELGDLADGECRAGQIATLGAIRFSRDGADHAHAVAPIYLRMSEAEERAKEHDGPGA